LALTSLNESNIAEIEELENKLKIIEGQKASLQKENKN